MSGIQIDELPHSCGTLKGLKVFYNPDTDKVDGFCFACPGGKYIANPYGEKVDPSKIKKPKVRSAEDVERELEEIVSYQTVDLPTRKLRAEHLKKFGVKTSVSEEDGKTPTACYFPIHKGEVVTGYYIKTLGENKKQWAIGDVKGGEPFGWQRAKRSGAHTLIIFEGKEDAVAGEAIFSMYGQEKYKPACIALPNGVNSVNSSLTPIAQEALKIFNKIVICFDNDKAGQEAVPSAMQLFPNAHTATLPEKDMNDCLLKGSGEAAYKVLSFKTSPPKNSRIIWANDDLHKSAREPTPFGELTWPWPTMNDLTRNIRYGETIYMGAGVKMSKSEMVNTLASHFIKEHGIKVFLAKPEEELRKSYKLILGKLVGKIFHDPKVPFNYEAYDAAGLIAKDKLGLLDLYQHIGWESLRADIIYAAKNGARAIFIDPITNLTTGINSADANTKLQEIAVDLSALAKDLDVVIFLFCHLKAPEGNISADKRKAAYDKGNYIRLGNCPHERGGDVLSNQFAGSRAMMRSCNLMLGIEGNKDPDLPEHIRNMRYLSFLEDREFGNSAVIPLYWNKNTQLFTEA